MSSKKAAKTTPEPVLENPTLRAGAEVSGAPDADRASAPPKTPPASSPRWFTADEVKARLGMGVWTVPAVAMRGPLTPPPKMEVSPYRFPMAYLQLLRIVHNALLVTVAEPDNQEYARSALTAKRWLRTTCEAVRDEAKAWREASPTTASYEYYTAGQAFVKARRLLTALRVNAPEVKIASAIRDLIYSAEESYEGRDEDPSSEPREDRAP